MFMIALCAIAVVAFAFGFIGVFFVNVPAWTAAVFSNVWKGPCRSRGPGLRLCIPGLESVVEEHSIKERMTPGEMDAETQDEVPVPLSFFMEWHPDPSNMITFLGFEQADIEKALVERFKSIVSIIVRAKETFDEVYDKLDAIACEVYKNFTEVEDDHGQTLAGHYGIVVSATRFSDPKVPQKIADAKLELEAMRKTNQKRTIEMKTTNALRGKEMKKLEALAHALVQKAKENGQELNFQTALKEVRFGLGISPEENRNYGLNPDTLNVLKNILS